MIFAKLATFYFFYFAAVGAYIIFLPKVLYDIGYIAKDIGIILAIAPLMRFATPFLFLKHISLNQELFRYILLLSIISSYMFYITIESFYLFLINNAILGICLSILLPYIEVVALKNLGKEKYGKVRLFGSIGFVLTALILAKTLLTTQKVINFYFLTTCITVISSYYILQYDNINHENITKNDKFSILKYWQFWLSLLFMQISFGGFYNFFTIYEIDNNISIIMTSYLWSFGVICEIVMLFFQGRILRYNLINIIKFSIAITVVRWLLLYLYPHNITIVFLSQSIHAFSFGLYHSAIIVYLYTLYNNKQLAQQFMFGIAYGLGGFMGSLIAGITYGRYLFLYSSIIGIVSLIFITKHQNRIS